MSKIILGRNAAPIFRALLVGKKALELAKLIHEYESELVHELGADDRTLHIHKQSLLHLKELVTNIVERANGSASASN